jgi:beta-N-acetylhexosaminidase
MVLFDSYNFRPIRIRIILFFLALTYGYSSMGQSYLDRENEWISEVMATMNMDEKIGQMIMVRAYSKGDMAEKNYIENLIKSHFIGGVCFFQGKPETQVQYTNYFQQISKVPLFISIDGEWGIGMRHAQNAISFPRNLQLGAVRDEKLIYQLGKEIGYQCKSMGINVNFSPVADINSNPSNPVINERSFGQSRENVTAKAFLMFKGLEDAGVLSCAKHFPGHGDTKEDSHYDLPVLNHDKNRLEEIDLFPFRRLAAQNIGSIMVGHLHIPALDDRENRPASLSRKIVTDLLRKDIGYQGLIITDALDMKAVTRHFPPGVAEAEAVLAGNDILLLPENVRLAVQTIKNYIRENKITLEQIDQSVCRILSAKYKLGLSVRPQVEETRLNEKLNSLKALALKAKLVENAVTILKDDNNLLPIKETKGINTATLSVNVLSKSVFQERVDDYTKAFHYQLHLSELQSKKSDFLNTFSQFDRVIVAIHSSIKNRSANRDLPPNLIRFLEEMQSQSEIIIVFFGNPYVSNRLEAFSTVVLGYDDEPVMQDIAVQSIFGANAVSGALPIQVSQQFRTGMQITKPSLGRLGYGLPEQVGLSSEKLKGIDSLMETILLNKATPGAQIVVAKNGKIVFQKEYGVVKPGGEKVKPNTVYDVASLTKIMSATLAAMKLYDDQKLVLHRPLKFYISDLLQTNKAEMKLEDVMAHQAGLRAYIPFYESTMTMKGKTKIPDTLWYKHTFTPEYSIPVAEKLFLRSDYRDSIWNRIYHSDLRPSSSYRYSDLGFFLVQKAVEEISRQPLDSFVYSHFYNPLDLTWTCYKPLDKIPQSQIAPTEIDNYFRMKTIQGTVHDMSAAMLGGVAGHAGVFSTAKETTVLMQMLLNGGQYGGTRFLKPETVQLFTKRYKNSTRRGLGFDMKELSPIKTENMSPRASDATFGHTGFTGSATFVDPENEIIFTFLSNRTYPSMANNTLHDKKYRAKLQSIVYKAIMP